MAVELHAGSVAVESREGDGARFTVRLPLHHAPTTKLWPPIAADTPAIDAGSPMVVPADSAPSVLPGVERGKN
jgi:hypothetical protein